MQKVGRWATQSNFYFGGNAVTEEVLAGIFGVGAKGRRQQMSITDRELLELAAKAAGIVLGEHARFIGDHPQPWFHNDSRKHPMCRKPNRAGNVPWAPLADDGDALRLAARLRLDINHGSPLDNSSYVSVSRCGIEMVRDPIDVVEEFDGEVGRAEATRRAIVRVAAEIGRAMP